MARRHLLHDGPESPLAPGEAGRGLLRVTPAVAVGILLLNDHILKTASPGVLTGKLSDVAGLAFFPLLLVAAVELVASVVGRPVQRPGRLLAWALVVTGVSFAIIKVEPMATAVWAASLGTMQWPFASVLALANGTPVPSWHEVSAVTDPTDLLALPALVLAWADGRRRLRSRTRWIGAPAPRVPTGRLPIGALLLAGLASLATSPATGTSTTVELAIRSELTELQPVEIRTFDFTLDESAMEGTVVASVTATGFDEGVRYVLASGTQQDRNDPNVQLLTHAALTWGRCESDPCTRTVTLITQLIDPSTGPVTATTTLEASVTSTSPSQRLAADKISFVERDEVDRRAAPSVVSGELSGDATIGPGNRGVDLHLAIHVDPGAVSDPSRMILGGRLLLEASGGPAEFLVNTGYPKVYEPGQRVKLDARLLPIPMPILLSLCPRAKPCDMDYVVRLTPASALSDTTVVGWATVLEMLDYDAEQAPDGRVITIELLNTTAVEPSAAATSSPGT